VDVVLPVAETGEIEGRDDTDEGRVIWGSVIIGVDLRGDAEVVEPRTWGVETGELLIF
jgi:hypothetical protein